MQLNPIHQECFVQSKARPCGSVEEVESSEKLKDIYQLDNR